MHSNQGHVTNLFAVDPLSLLIHLTISHTHPISDNQTLIAIGSSKQMLCEQIVNETENEPLVTVHSGEGSRPVQVLVGIQCHRSSGGPELQREWASSGLEHPGGYRLLLAVWEQRLSRRTGDWSV